MNQQIVAQQLVGCTHRCAGSGVLAKAGTAVSSRSSWRRSWRAIGVGSALWWVMLSATAQAQAAPVLHLETCTGAAQSCVGSAESADAWLPPGAGPAALRQLADALRAARGLPADVAVRLSCSSGTPDAALVAELRAAGYRVHATMPALVAQR
jgi:hypothetical protein